MLEILAMLEEGCPAGRLQQSADIKSGTLALLYTSDHFVRAHFENSVTF